MKLEMPVIHRSWLSLVGLTLLACSSNDAGHVTEHSAPSGISDLSTLSDLSASFRELHADPKELVVTKETTDEQGDVHTRYAQFKNGLRVIGGELMVHRRAGKVYAVNGSARADREAPAAPVLSPARAIARALAGRIGARAEPHPPLAYRIDDAGDSLALVYEVNVTGTEPDGSPVVDTVLVNAVDGAIVDTISHIQGAKLPVVHTCRPDPRKPPLNLPCPLAISPGPGSDPTVDVNYLRLGSVYDAYNDLFSLDTLGGSDGKLHSAVHYGGSGATPTFWNGSQIVFRDGDGANFSAPVDSIDLTAHEATHSMIDRSSALRYSGEPGALNESLADIFGAVVEWYTRGRVLDARTWQFAEDVYTPGIPGDALRYLNDPKKDGRSIDYYPDFDAGVDLHYASGIGNLAFYLLAQGGKHPRGKTTITVNGVGFEKAFRIFYRANRDFFLENTTFARAKSTTRLAATNLGYTRDEVESVAAAWAAVGVP
ncbi:M4 family metallopeptidase [Pendulispora albinea]|uniref:Neutral metalloproteinase n=1 Tax=Pendulispora albinea TaxID=2741071 RepID=A0ABZ2MBE8_9BACT